MILTPIKDICILLTYWQQLFFFFKRYKNTKFHVSWLKKIIDIIHDEFYSANCHFEWRDDWCGQFMKTTLALITNYKDTRHCPCCSQSDQKVSRSAVKVDTPQPTCFWNWTFNQLPLPEVNSERCSFPPLLFYSFSAASIFTLQVEREGGGSVRQTGLLAFSTER